MPARFSQELSRELCENAQKIGAPGKGILAADESTGTIAKRFSGINVENSEENRAAYRNLLFSTKDLNKYISGVILYEETLYQEYKGVKMVDLLNEQGILPGIKVDTGLTILPGTEGENATQGLDGLAERCKKYYTAGCRFAKYRCVLKINKALQQPSQLAITENAHTLARYAAICQENGLVPIVEPEILQDGDHDITYTAEIAEKVLAACFKALNDHHILLEGCLLKPAMVTPGSECATRNAPEEIAFYTVRTLYRTVPPALAAVTFLSGGQSEEEASVNLNAMNRDKKHPYSLTFSYGRALQATVLKVWGGKAENVEAAQQALIDRARANGEAQLGTYQGGVQSSGSLFQKGYVY